MLIAIGIYKYTQHKKQITFQKIECVPAVGRFQHEFNGLANFEKLTIPILENFIGYDINIIEAQGRREFHYLNKINADTMIVLISKRRIECTRERPELYYLQRNVELAYRYPERTRTTISNILNNPLGYIGRDILFDGIQQAVDETKEELLKALDELIRRQEKIAITLKHAADLDEQSNSFKIQTTKLNRGCCG